VKFFGAIHLEKLANPDLIRLYQMERNKTAGASIINHECSVIQQMLKRIRKWAEVAPFYQPIPLPRESPDPGGGAQALRGRRAEFKLGRRLLGCDALRAHGNWAGRDLRSAAS
jgi:hypothetical protein